jgi:hypothetical protein
MGGITSGQKPQYSATPLLHYSTTPFTTSHDAVNGPKILLAPRIPDRILFL